MKSPISRINACGASLAVCLLSIPMPSIGQPIRQSVRVSGTTGSPAGAAINSVLNAISPQMQMQVLNFLQSPDYDALRLNRKITAAAGAAIQAQPSVAGMVSNPLAPSVKVPQLDLTAPMEPSSIIARFGNPQSEEERIFVAEKMQGLIIAMGPFLPEQTRLQLTQAAKLTQARLSPADQQKLVDKMGALAQALGKSVEMGGADSAAPGVLGGGADENSFARRHSKLSKASAPNPATTPKIVETEWQAPEDFEAALDVAASLSQPKRTYVQKAINFGVLWDSFTSREWQVKAVAGGRGLHDPVAAAYMGPNDDIGATRVLARPAKIMDDRKFQALQDDLFQIDRFESNPADLAAKMARRLEDVKRQGAVPMVLYRRSFDTVFGDIPLSPVQLGVLDDMKQTVLHLGQGAPSRRQFLADVEGLMTRMRAVNQWDYNYPDQLRQILADAKRESPRP